MDDDLMFHNWVARTLRNRLSREYKEVFDNIEKQNKDISGAYPDLIFGHHGFVIGAIEVETEKTISANKAVLWKAVATSGTKLVLMVPKKTVKQVTDLLWDAGVADRVSIGTYEVSIQMP